MAHANLQRASIRKDKENDNAEEEVTMYEVEGVWQDLVLKPHAIESEVPTDL